MGSVKTDQLIAPFGVGEIVTFPGEKSIMVGGLNLWDDQLNQLRNLRGNDRIDERELEIPEPRLKHKLGIRSIKRPFPYYYQRRVNNRLTIPGVRFPGWHYCSSCGHLRLVSPSNREDDIRCKDCNNKGKMLPLRFVAICSQGHVEDLPLEFWAHFGQNKDHSNGDKKLYYKVRGGSGDLNDIIIKCECGCYNSLGGITDYKKDDNDHVNETALSRIGINCSGMKPWLGWEEGYKKKDDCGDYLFVTIKGGSNVYYSHTYSAIYLPPSNSGIVRVVDYILNNDHTMVSNLLYQDEDGTTLKNVLRSKPEVIDSGYDAEEVYNRIVEKFQGSANQEIGPDEIKREEYNYFVNSENIQDPKLNTTNKNIGKYEEGKFLKQYFDQIILLNRLKETQVLTGFSRFEPSMSDSNRREKMRMLKGDDPNWLPGKENYGEGIFIQFNQEKLEEWYQNYNNSFSGQIERYNSSNFASQDETYTHLPYIMLHTFAHLLIKRLCFKCGYGSSSLKERIYYESPNDNPGNPMAGILIYTASAGAEGSMGGLVRQGQEDFLGETVLEAICEAEWCSADPVCADIGQNSGQGPSNVNGSACHNCCLLPETSCEKFNILLDRATIAGTIHDRSLGFFKYFFE